MLSCRRLRRQPRRDDGAVAVEFALILPVLVMLISGIVTAGLSYTHSIGLTNAVREGARFGATADTTSGSWASDVANRVRATQYDDAATLPNSTTAVCVQLGKANGTGGFTASATAGTSACSNGAKTPTLSTGAGGGAPLTTGIAADTCIVRVWAARKFEISLIVFPVMHGTTVRTSVARYERGTC